MGLCVHVGEPIVQRFQLLATSKANTLGAVGTRGCYGGPVTMYVYYCRTYEKPVSAGGRGGKRGHVLKDTSRGLCVRRVRPPRRGTRKA